MANPESVPQATSDALLRDYHDARRREEQWRIPQVLLALLAPILAVMTVVFNMAYSDSYANIVSALMIIVAIGAALLSIEVWRWHRIATSRVNEFRTQYPADAALLMKDPI